MSWRFLIGAAMAGALALAVAAWFAPGTLSRTGRSEYREPTGSKADAGVSGTASTRAAKRTAGLESDADSKRSSGSGLRRSATITAEGPGGVNWSLVCVPSHGDTRGGKSFPFPLILQFDPPPHVFVVLTPVGSRRDAQPPDVVVRLIGGEPGREHPYLGAVRVLGAPQRIGTEVRIGYQISGLDRVALDPDRSTQATFVATVGGSSVDLVLPVKATLKGPDISADLETEHRDPEGTGKDTYINALVALWGVRGVSTARLRLFSGSREIWFRQRAVSLARRRVRVPTKRLQVDSTLEVQGVSIVGWDKVPHLNCLLEVTDSEGKVHSIRWAAWE